MHLQGLRNAQLCLPHCHVNPVQWPTAFVQPAIMHIKNAEDGIGHTTPQGVTLPTFRVNGVNDNRLQNAGATNPRPNEMSAVQQHTRKRKRSTTPGFATRQCPLATKVHKCLILFTAVGDSAAHFLCPVLQRSL